MAIPYLSADLTMPPGVLDLLVFGVGLVVLMAIGYTLGSLRANDAQVDNETAAMVLSAENEAASLRVEVEKLTKSQAIGARALSDLGRISAMSFASLPSDRMDRMRSGVQTLDNLASLVPAIGHSVDRARAVLRNRSVVEAIGSLWGARHHPGRLGIMPDVRARIDHDARMKAAEGAFG